MTYVALGRGSVACPVSGRCVAAGSTGPVGGTSGPLPGIIESLANGAWSGKDTPFPSGATSDIAKLGPAACTSKGQCIAVGFNGSTPQSDEGLIVSFTA